MRKTGPLALLTGTTLALGLATGYLSGRPQSDAGDIRRNDEGRLETAEEIAERESSRPFSAATIIDSVYGVPADLEWRDDEQKPSPYEIQVDEFAVLAFGAVAIGGAILSRHSTREEEAIDPAPAEPVTEPSAGSSAESPAEPVAGRHP